MPPSDRYLRVVEHLLTDAPKNRVLLHVEDTAAFVAMEDASLAIVIRPTKRGDELRAALKAQLAKNDRAHHKLVVIGGDADMQAILTACQPGIFSRVMVQVYHLADDGTVWGGRASRVDSPMGHALRAAAEMPADARVDVEALLAKLHVPTQAQAKAAVEQRAFVQRYAGVRPVVTIGATGLILGVFGLQVTWGGPAFIPSLVRMGANMGTAVETEPWRLLSSTLLHGNFVHVGMNAFVLYVLGAHLERILGWRRMLLLLVAAGLGGGLASATFMDALVSVGASGAIWGLLGGALGLALRPGTLVPAPQVAALKRVALINLALNISASFMPGIDFMAHLGGGVVGLALTASGLLTRNLAPFVEDPERGSDAHPALTAGAYAAAALTVGALVAAIIVGKPWVLAGRPPTQRVSVGDTHFSVVAPQAEVEVEAQPSGVVGFGAGDVLADPYFVGVEVRPWTQAVDGPLQRAEIDAWLAADAPVPPDATRVRRTVVSAADPPTYDDVFAYPNGALLYHRAYMFEDAEVLVSAFVFDGAPKAITAAALGSIASLQATRKTLDAALE